MHRALGAKAAQSFGGQSLSSRPSRRRVEGSCIGFWKSKANSTFCKVVKQKGEACFCRLCNQVLSKTLRFSLQRQKAPEFGIRRILGIVCRFLWHRASFWQPLQPWFVKETAFFFAKAQNSGIRLVPDSGTGYRFYAQSFELAQSFVLASKYP